MKRFFILSAALLFIGGAVFGLYLNPEVAAGIQRQIFGGSGVEPDVPRFAEFKVNKEDYMTRRAEMLGMYRGVHKDEMFDPQLRVEAVKEFEQKQSDLARFGSPQAAWVPLGPAPIPNGQTIGFPTPVSGRTISIAVHPTNPDIVYVGTAQGGLYRSTNGGTNWTPLMDNALSLAIGAIAIAPSQPDTIYVGTGEAGFCGDCFFGVGVYRIDNASSASPVITGPLNDDATTADIFTGRSIGEIVVHPTDPATIFVASASGGGGIGGQANNVLPARGIYRSTNATAASPTFAKLTGLAGNLNGSVRDIVIDPLNPNLLIANLIAGGGTGGIYVSTDALAPAPTFTLREIFNSGATSELTAEFAIHHTSGPNPTIYAATGNLGGRVLISIDGGTTWTQRIDNNFCTPQCFYDIAIAVDPTNADNVFLGGAPALAFGRSTNGGTTFTNNAATAQGLHVDSHAIAVSPSQPSTIYFGSDGGIYRSNNSGTNWTPLNNSEFSATQFMSLAVHPLDRFLTIGGTQDNGTNLFRPNQTWTNSEGGDGGYTVIDQNAQNNTAVTMYHTFFNQTNAMGYSRSLNAGDNWTFFGCGFGGVTPNGMTCAASAILFYAPMERGPGTPNTLYFGSDVLYRSSDSGATMTKVSQEPIQAGVAISAIGVSAQDDRVRIIGQNNGNIFGTSTGVSPLVNLDPSNTIPNAFVGRAVIDPNNPTTAYVTLAAFGIGNVWKTTNLSDATPVWAAATSGLPQVPVNAFVVDPQDSNTLYAGTDIGVFQSTNGGTSWVPFGTGLPRVAVFDAEIVNIHRVLRIATHGRGIYEIPIPGQLLPVIRAGGNGTSGPGGASALVAESCLPGNGAIDPGETVTVSFDIQNVGGGPTTNLVATLQPTGGVTSPSGPQNYGAIAAASTASRNFTFTAAGNCGDTITLTFQLQDGAANLGTLSVTYTLGAIVAGTPLIENFDGVVAPALPAGITTAQSGSAPLWTTTTAFFDTAPNSAATGGTTTPGDNSLTSDFIDVPAAPGTGTNPGVQLSFKNNFNTEAGFDGGVLEISINGGPFADIITAGGSFVAGGYNGAIGVTDSVLTGRAAWTGTSGGFITTTVNLPPASFGQEAQIRFRTAYDTGTNPANGGQRIDTVSIYTVTRLCCQSSSSTANLGGRITNSVGRGIGRVAVRLTDGATVNQLTTTSSFGFYTFQNVPTGVTYTVTPVNRRLTFVPVNRIFNHTGAVSNLDFLGQ
ncbi:MAG: carboxypeptidase regulatory-like domain-containing protein [Saprospiraceae bacterium]|nr:carboxypeptidase regulatory-like domain-containing protein [Pyrinomonadaceae bacterium]